MVEQHEVEGSIIDFAIILNYSNYANFLDILITEDWIVLKLAFNVQKHERLLQTTIFKCEIDRGEE